MSGIYRTEAVVLVGMGQDSLNLRRWRKGPISHMIVDERDFTME